MTRHLGHRVLFALQVAIALAVIAFAGSLRFAVLSAGAASAVLLIRQRGTLSVAFSVVMTVAVVALLTLPSATAHRRGAAGNGRAATHRPCARRRTQNCRYG